MPSSACSSTAGTRRPGSSCTCYRTAGVSRISASASVTPASACGKSWSEFPSYAPEPGLHDFIVQADGAFEETVHGILNLATLGQCIELRVVIQKHTVPALPELAIFIARNLPFVDQVALMGLEMTGLARPNSAEVWIDPADYQAELADATVTLAAAGIVTKIFNHQLCVLDERLWPFAVRSISDWKNDYLEICDHCSVRDTCGGVFATSGNRLSRALQPIHVSASAGESGARTSATSLTDARTNAHVMQTSSSALT